MRDSPAPSASSRPSAAKVAAFGLLALLALVAVAGAASAAASASWGANPTRWTPTPAYGSNTLACTDPDGVYNPMLIAYAPNGAEIASTYLNPNGATSTLQVPMSAQGSGYRVDSVYWTKMGGYCIKMNVGASATTCYDSVRPTSSGILNWGGQTPRQVGSTYYFRGSTAVTPTVSFSDGTPNCNGTTLPGYACVDSDTPSACARATSRWFNDQSPHDFLWYGSDVAGNREDAKRITVLIDRTSPSIGFSQGCVSTWCASGSVLASATDTVSGLERFRCWGPGFDVTDTVAPFQIEITPPDGRTSYTCEANDWALNSASLGSPTYQFDRSPPSQPTYVVSCTWGQSGWWCKSAATLTASNSNDPHSGIKEYRVRYKGVDNVGATSAQDTTEDQGGNYFEYWSVNNAGLESTRGSRWVDVDTVAPVPTITPSCTQSYCNVDVHLDFSFLETTSGVASSTCKVNNNPVSCGGHWLTDTGSYTVTAVGTDAAGNTGPTASRNVRIDKHAPWATPQSTCQGLGEGSWCQSAASLSYSTGDSGGSNVASTSCTIDGWWASCSNPQTYGAAGWHRFRVVVTDGAGNSNAGSEYNHVDFGVDPSPPSVSITGPASDSWQKTSFTVTVSESDAISDLAICHFRTTATTEQERPCREPFTVDCGVVQSCTVFASATDLSGRKAETSRSFRIDPTAPTTTALAQGQVSSVPNQRWYSTDATVTLSCVDGPVGQNSGCASTRYRVDGGAEQVYSAPIALSTDGDHEIEFYSVDGAGNEEARQVVRVGVDRVAPAASVSQTGAYSTSTTPPSFQVSFADDDAGGSGLSACYVKVVGFSAGLSTGDSGWLDRACDEQDRRINVDLLVLSGHCRIVPQLGGTCRVSTYVEDVAGNASPESFLEVEIAPRP